MKTLHLSIITIVGIGIIITVYLPNVYAPCAIGPNGTQLCAGAPPIHMTVKSDSMAYADDDNITISGNIDQYLLSKYGTHLSIKIYNPKMVLYRSDQFNTTSNGSFAYSFKIVGENATSGYYNFYLSPDLNAMSYGSAFMYQAAPYDLEINGTHYSLVYALVDGVINKIDTNLMEKSITIHVVNATGHSTLKIKLPRDLIDSKSDQGDTSFTVLADNTPETQYMQSVNFNETQTYSDARTLLIDLPFHPYSTDGSWYVKIIGTKMDLENKNPPVIITQVELDDPYKTIPWGISCMQWNEMADQRLVPYYCTENVIPKEAVECGYSMIYPHVCNPVHKTYNFTNACPFYSGFRSDGTPIVEKYAKGDQWIVMYNMQDKPVNISNFNMKWNSTGFYENYDANFSLTLSQHEQCTLASDFVESTTGAALIQYKYLGNNYVFKTPQLVDDYHDLRTWQFDGNKWVFAENDTLKLGPPASNMSIQEVNAGENSQWSSLLIFGAIGGVIVATILLYVIKTRKRKTIK